MLAISLTPGATEAARLVTSLAGPEWFEFEAALAPTTKLRFATDGRSFPARGTVSIRRGPDRSASGERIVDSFRYIESCTSDDTGEHVQERFGVTLFMAEEAFDRMVARVQWGLPALDLFFDPSSQVIKPDRNRTGDLSFHPRPQPWEVVASATLTQVPGSGTR